MWRKANPIARIGMVATVTVATIAAIAIIVGAVRSIGWRVQVNEALTAQSQSQSQYDFNPGNIISDGTFFNGNALSEQQVSTIIEQQGVACSGERCLKSMTFSTESQSADEYCQAYDGGPNESAAAIVYKAGARHAASARRCCSPCCKGAASAHGHQSKRFPIQSGDGPELPG